MWRDVLKRAKSKTFCNEIKEEHKKILQDFPNVKIESEWDRMYVLLNGERAELVMEELKKVFGIQSFSPAIKTEKDIEKIREAALHIMKKRIFQAIRSKFQRVDRIKTLHMTQTD
ncbi:hypothetical protein ACI2OX_07725 [Bacillus sp. N9]